MNFVIFHGSFRNPEENWFPYLKGKLEELGHAVWTPTFPVEDWDEMVAKGESYQSTIQTLNTWTKTFEKDVLPKLPKEDLVFIGHSISAVFILHLVEKFNLKLEMALFVSPFLSELDRWEFNAVNNSFYKTGFDFEELRKHIAVSYAIYGEDDPYVGPEKFEEFIQHTKSSAIPVKHGGHLGTNAGFKEFPLLLDLCKTRF